MNQEPFNWPFFCFWKANIFLLTNQQYLKSKIQNSIHFIEVFENCKLMRFSKFGNSNHTPLLSVKINVINCVDSSNEMQCSCLKTKTNLFLCTAIEICVCISNGTVICIESPMERIQLFWVIVTMIAVETTYLIYVKSKKNLMMCMDDQVHFYANGRIECATIWQKLS